jgi:hypothetical protein
VRELFDEINPITDFIGRDLELTFNDYYLDEPKFDEKTSIAKRTSTLRRRSRQERGSSTSARLMKSRTGSLPWATCRS